eukprot:s4810_g4.t1
MIDSASIRQDWQSILIDESVFFSQSCFLPRKMREPGTNYHGAHVFKRIQGGLSNALLLFIEIINGLVVVFLPLQRAAAKCCMAREVWCCQFRPLLSSFALAPERVFSPPIHVLACVGWNLRSTYHTHLPE